MCGLVVVLSHGTPLWPGDLSNFYNLLYVGALRGTDGTGVFTATEDGSRFQMKVGGPPTQLFESDDYKKLVEFIDRKDAMFLVGHNRFATVGKPTADNAHPFHHGKITMVHNGTIVSWGKFKEEAHKFPVDSEAVCWLVDKYGIEEVVSSISGAWALIYWDETAKTLNVVKNDQRPLFAAHAIGGKVWYMASEKEMLDWVINRNYHVPLEIKAVQNNQLISFTMGEADPAMKRLETRSEKGQREYEEACRNKKPTNDSGKDFKHNSTSKVQADLFEVPEPETKKVTGHGSYPFPVLVQGGSSGRGEWGRGKTGQVPNPATVKESWVEVGSLKDLVKGKTLSLELADYDPVKDVFQGFQMFLMHEKYPDVRFVCNIQGMKEMDALIEATRVEATILNIQKSNNNAVFSPHKVVLSFPVPINDSNIIIPAEADIPDNAYDLSGGDLNEQQALYKGE